MKGSNNVSHDKEQRLRKAHDGLRTFHLFAGAGGGILADLLLGHIPVGACEIEDYPRAVLLQRQRDGILPEFPIWDDICTLDGKPWRGSVDVVAGGFPCQDISCAGRGDGINGERSGLWDEMRRVICEIRPRFAFVENSPTLTSRGLGRVLGDLAEMGYDARWCVLGSDNAGGFHKRKRIWIMAYNSRDYVARDRLEESREWVAQIQSKGLPSVGYKPNKEAEVEFKPGVDGVIYGVANPTHRLKAIGNGQDPRVASLAWRILTEGL